MAKNKGMPDYSDIPLSSQEYWFYSISKRAKAANLDAIHDTVHEMARDEARHGKAFARYIPTSEHSPLKLALKSSRISSLTPLATPTARTGSGLALYKCMSNIFKISLDACLNVCYLNKRLYFKAVIRTSFFDNNSNNYYFLYFNKILTKVKSLSKLPRTERIALMPMWILTLILYAETVMKFWTFGWRMSFW